MEYSIRNRRRLRTPTAETRAAGLMLPRAATVGAVESSASAASGDAEAAPAPGLPLARPPRA